MHVLCIRCMPVTLEGQKELEPLKVKLQMVVSCLVGAGIKPWFSSRAAKALNCLAISTALHFSSSVGPGTWFSPAIDCSLL